MLIDWEHFTPWTSLYGGVLIGIASALLILLNGRVAGICGIVSGLLLPKAGDLAWRFAFLTGLTAAPLLWQASIGLPEIRIDADFGTLVIAGLLVGIGTRYGAGCTSGHGVCGIARRSPRSVIATLAFMCSGFVTVFLARHALGA